MAAWQKAAAPPAAGRQASGARLEKAHEAWDAAITVSDETRKEQAKGRGLAEPAKNALATLDREWDGLIAHREYPMAGLDNYPDAAVMPVSGGSGGPAAGQGGALAA